MQEIKRINDRISIVKRVDSYYPSSKMRSHCENEKDRDINASINITFKESKIHYQS